MNIMSLYPVAKSDSHFRTEAPPANQPYRRTTPPPPLPFLASALSQALRDEYPSLYLISACVGPFGAGDTPLQHYNSALALHHLQVFADAVIYRGNDDLLQEAKVSARKRASHPNAAGGSGGGGGEEWSGSGGGGARWQPVGLFSRGRSGSSSGRSNIVGGSLAGAGAVSMTDMNASLSLDMASLFFPTSSPRPRVQDGAEPSLDSLGGGPRPPRPAQVGRHRHHHHRRETADLRPFDGGCLVSVACPLPGAKFVDLRSTLSVGLGHRSSSSLSSRGLSQSRPPKAGERRGVGVGAGALAGGLGVGGGGGWAALAGGLGKAAPLCPRRGGGGREGDACVAAYHVVRGIGVDEGAPAVTAAAASTVDGAAREASEALRGHHECPEWRTATDASYSSGVSPAGGWGRADRRLLPMRFVNGRCAYFLCVLSCSMRRERWQQLSDSS